jgi:hypothetical protein
LLYKEIEGKWHYVRISVETQGVVRTESGRCGTLPHTVTLSPFDSVSPEEALRQEGRQWQGNGYGKPHPKQMQVMTLHFQLPRWRGMPTAAPWFENWSEYYLDPILQQLDATANGSLRSHEHISGNYLYYYMVFDAEAARNMVEATDAAAPKKYPLDIYIGKREKKVNIPLDPSIPDYLRSMLRSFEQTAHLLSDHLPNLVAATDPLQLESIPLLPDKRVRGTAARALQESLWERWQYKGQPSWQPPVGTPQTVCLDTVPVASAVVLTGAIRTHGSPPCYLWESDYGMFEVTPEQLFMSAYEGIAFDASFEWVIYFSQHFSMTFCGEWLAPLAGVPNNSIQGA